MKFYKISYDHIGGKTYPWASGYGPIENMPFLDGVSPIIRDRELAFWKVNPMPPGIQIDPGGKSWSDMIGCGAGVFIN
jgi:hypothetical protein